MPKTESRTGEKPVERVFLIDSMSHIFRAFYAPLANRAAPLMTSKGQVTQAVYIFTNMLRKLIQDEKPKYIAAVFESKEKTFRHEAFTDYKANRQQMPEDLASQLPYIKRLCEAYNIPTITVPGFEADDVIGTLAKQAADKGLQAVIVSNDKDMCQMVVDPWIICMRQNSQVVKRKRSEEHTSELQSQSNLVCRLLLEKKKKSQNLLITKSHSPQFVCSIHPDLGRIAHKFYIVVWHQPTLLHSARRGGVPSDGRYSARR